MGILESHTGELVPETSNLDSIYSIMNNIVPIDGNLKTKVSFQELEKTLSIYRSINVSSLQIRQLYSTLRSIS